ncbi:hypothetical protein BDDG_13220, partial [Blastomyces dermatitidis ATCC 18188]
SSIPDRRSAAATNTRSIRSDSQPLLITDPRPLRTRVAYAPILSHSQSPILGRYKRAYILPPRSSTTYTTTYVYKYPSQSLILALSLSF